MRNIPLILCFLIICLPACLFGQVISDNFEDGDLSSNPAWTGDESAFFINEAFQLQLNFQEDSLRPVYLATTFNPTNLADKEWRFDLRLDFSPSSTNRVIIYLASGTPNLLDFVMEGSQQAGYYLEIGENGNEDGISLFYRNAGSTELIARGADGEFASAFDVRIRVRRDAAGNWEIATDPNKREKFIIKAMGTENSLSNTGNLGFICYFSTTRRNLFYFDKVYFGDFLFDTTPPELLTAEAVSERQIKLVFSEPLEKSSAENITNYSLSPGNILPQNAIHDADTIWLNFEQSFDNGTNYSIIASNVADLSGNVMTNQTIEFLYFIVEEAAPGDVIINEFFANPNPSVGLPTAEFVELYNRSNKFISLENWKLTDNTSSEGSLPYYILHPNAFVILSPSNAAALFSTYGSVISPSSWQTLNIMGDSITIQKDSNLIIDNLKYDRSWYQDEAKDDGGYTLERINPFLACSNSENWRASIDQSGGTPGRENAVLDADFTGAPPAILDFEISNSNSLLITFDRAMDAEAVKNADYTLSPDAGTISAEIDESNKREVILTFSEAFINDQTYELEIESIVDCNGNMAKPLYLSFTFDDIPPQLENIIFLADTIMLLEFNEPLLKETVEEVSHYAINPLAIIVAAQLFNQNQVLLFLQNKLALNFPYQLTINLVADEAGNLISNLTQSFTFEAPATPGFNQLIITEIMAKPAADQILPHVQYVELYNPTDQLVSLVGLQYMDERDTVSLGLNYILPGEYILLAPSSTAAQLQDFARVIGISPWPNLNNSGDDLQIIDQNKSIVFQAFYRDSWYKEDFKKDDGGWSLEMIDDRNPCAGNSNWRASIADLQGTPGAKNSVAEENLDLNGPILIKAFAPNTTEVMVYFNEAIDIEHVRTNQFSISPNLDISNLKLKDLHTIKLELTNPLELKVNYKLTVNNLTDCVGNLIQSSGNTTYFALVEEVEQGDIVLNEVLYDPRTGGTDFIELYNNSDKHINLSNWLVVGPSQEQRIFENDDVVMPPGTYLALTENFEALVSHYPNSHDPEYIAITNLPSFPNGAGLVQLISANGQLEEKFEYSDELHLIFLRTVDGVSLERISPHAPIDDPNSWSSAASSSGYATPGMVNSQRTMGNVSFGTVEAKPSTFAHNAPGRNYTLINYTIEDAGNTASVYIYDAKGTLIYTLANNETLSNTGFFRWDGDDLNGRKVRTGYYIIYFEVFTPEGNKRLIKERVAVGF